jgi:FlaA1/EpsC-like NDP-sugar epimerase
MKSVNKTYIIGTGYLSDNLKEKIVNSKIYSAQNFICELETINKKKEKFNLIINSFFSTRKLSNFKSYEMFAKKGIYELSKILDLLNHNIINKIIYTSSSSVYGSITNNLDLKDDNNRKIYAGFKIASEFLIKNYCNKNSISLHICRIFNLYGKKNKFSIIEKLKDIKKSNNKVSIYNYGLSLRDFIHIDDVVKIYKNILLKKFESTLYDVGTGRGIAIKEIIEKYKINKKNLIIKKKKINEIFDSIADNREWLKKNKIKFKKIEEYFGIHGELKSKKISNKNYIENNLIGSIIYGAGYSGKEIAKQMSSLDRRSISYFVDDDSKKIGKLINDIEIISHKKLKEIAKNTNIRNIIIAIPSLSSKKRSKLMRTVAGYSETISTLPEKSFFKKKVINLTDVKDVSFDELFGKETVKTEHPTIEKLKNQRILITGGAGSIGTELTKQISKSKPKLIIVLDQSELNIYRISKILNNKNIKLILGDIKDKDFVKNLIKKYKIDFIFHAAAYKHVKFLEDNIYSAFKNNIVGTYNLINSIKGKKIKFVFISTDKAVNPKNILGITKRIGELLTQIMFSNNDYKNAKFFILRFGNVIGSDGSALPFFFNQIKNNQTISLTNKNMSRYFMSIKEACNLVLQSSVSKYENKTLFLDMGKPIKIIEIIKKMFKVYGKTSQKLKIKIIGNKFNEKLSERLYLRNKVYKTSIDKVFSTKDKIINDKKFLDTLDEIILNINLFSKGKLKESLNKLLKIK